MNQYFRPSFWRVALKDPLTWLAIAVDLTPIVFVFMFGWGAAALVLLYWSENIVIGVATFVRIILSGVKSWGILGGLGSVFLAAFFTVHYGMFCYGHGVFVFSFAPGMNFDPPAPSPDALIGMVNAAIDFAPGMAIALGLISIYQAVALVVDYWPSRNRETPVPMVEMMSPYGRIIVLHIAIFAGAFAMAVLGDPMIGMLGLILLRAAFSVIGRSWRDGQKFGSSPFDGLGPEETPAPSKTEPADDYEFKWPYDDARR